MNYKKLKDWKSGFHNWVLRRHPTSDNKLNGFMGGFIFGNKGMGKSTYCYKVMAKIYYSLRGYSHFHEEEYAYKEALEYLMYDGDTFLEKIIDNKITRNITPVICLDDASMHFGTQLYKHNPKLYDEMSGEIATVRTAVTGFLVNAPKRSLCAKFLRENDDYKGEAMTDSGSRWMRKIRYYDWRYYPDEVKYRIKIPFQDKFSCYIPDEETSGFPFYNWYVDKKRFYEIKHEIEMADKQMKKNRKIFIKHYEEDKSRIPKDFWDIIDKWIKENNN